MEAYREHPAAALFPRMGGDEFDELVADIRGNGLLNPIVLLDGAVLDGRNRLAACEAAGVAPTFTDYAAECDPVTWVIAQNLKRRHLDASQRAMIAARMATLPRGRPEENRPIGLITPTQDEAAALLNVSPRSLRRAAKVLEEGAPETIAAVESGALPVSAAAELLELPHAEQAAIVANTDTDKIVKNRVSRKKRDAKAKIKRDAPVAALTLPPTIDLRLGDFRSVLADVPDRSVDLILTDPPYPSEYLPLWSDLATFAARVLKPDGMLAAMSGQTHLPEVINRLSHSLRYRWTMAYMMPGGANVVHARQVSTTWKPILIFGNSVRRMTDVVRSDTGDKAHHEWGQSESGMLALIQQLADHGAVVCDPFTGGGTTALVAHAHGCSFLGAELDRESYEKALRRVSA